MLTQKASKYTGIAEYINWLFSYNKLQHLFLYPKENKCFGRGIAEV